MTWLPANTTVGHGGSCCASCARDLPCESTCVGNHPHGAPLPPSGWWWSRRYQSSPLPPSPQPPDVGAWLPRVGSASCCKSCARGLKCESACVGHWTPRGNAFAPGEFPGVGETQVSATSAGIGAGAWGLLTFLAGIYIGRALG